MRVDEINHTRAVVDAVDWPRWRAAESSRMLYRSPDGAYVLKVDEDPVYQQCLDEAERWPRLHALDPLCPWFAPTLAHGQAPVGPHDDDDGPHYDGPHDDLHGWNIQPIIYPITGYRPHCGRIKERLRELGHSSNDTEVGFVCGDDIETGQFVGGVCVDYAY